MKISFYISVAMSALSLILAIIIFAVGMGNQGLQSEMQAHQKDIQKQQGEIQKQEAQIATGNQISQQVGPNLLRDMAVSSLKNDKMKSLLSKHGYNVQAQASPAPGGTGGAPAPTAPSDSVPSLR